MTTIQEVRELEALDEICRESKLNPVIIFKHSSTCPISAAAKREVDRYAALAEQNDPVIYQVVVQEARNLSNEIAARLKVVHESPQILLIKDGQAFWNCSHSQITAGNIRQAVQKLAGKA